MTDARQLLQGLRDGDPTARRQLFRELWDPPYRAALGTLKSQADAYDVTAGLLLDFMDHHVHDFRGESKAALKRYLRTSARRRAGGLRQVREAPLEHDLPCEGGEPIDPLLASRLEQCLGSLPPRARTILCLKYGGEQNNADIGRLLGQTRAAISKHLTHPQKGILARLRQCMSRPGRIDETGGETG